MSSEAAKLMHIINQGNVKLSESQRQRDSKELQGDDSGAAHEDGLVSDIRSTIAQARGQLSAVQSQAQKEEELKSDKQKDKKVEEPTLQFLDEPDEPKEKTVAAEDKTAIAKTTENKV